MAQTVDALNPAAFDVTTMPTTHVSGHPSTDHKLWGQAIQMRPNQYGEVLTKLAKSFAFMETENASLGYLLANAETSSIDERPSNCSDTRPLHWPPEISSQSAIRIHPEASIDSTIVSEISKTWLSIPFHFPKLITHYQRRTMISKTSHLLLLCTVALLISSKSAMAGLVLFSNYEFNGTLSDSLGNGADFSEIGSTTFSSGTLVFGEADGLLLSTPLTSGDYRIEMDLALSPLGQYHKLLDFQERSVDEGVYVNPGSVLDFYNSYGSGSDQLLSDIQYTIGLEKIGTSVTAYLNGTQQFTFLNPVPATSSSNSLVLFADDFAVSGEGAIGSVDSVRLYTVGVPEPSSIMLLLIAGSFAAIRVRHRKSFN